MSRTIHTIRFGNTKPLRITKITIQNLGNKHNHGRYGRPLHIIFQPHRFGSHSWALLVGLEGYGIHYDGWWKARYIQAYRQGRS